VAAGDAFIRQVRDALVHLHDLPHLQTHPLAARVGAPAPSGRALQRALEEVLGSLGSGRVPDLLRLRYGEALEPAVVWRRLGIGKSEYHRGHARGLAAVAQLVVERWGSEEAGDVRAARAPAWPARGNLPAELSSFVGRRREIADLGRLLCEARLVTLTGPPGAGKSRLALEVAARAGTRIALADGAWLVSLAPIADDRLVLPTIGRVLGIGEAGERQLSERLAEQLRDRQLLLLLDNFEHLLGAAPAVVELLRAAVGPRALVTSRSALRVPGEREYQVSGLSTVEATQLFVERASAMQPRLAHSVDEAASIAAICDRLDGLPLAIELAAARSKVLSPAAMLVRLDSRLSLLTAGPRAADDSTADRHRTLRAAIDWSHDLLAPDEQRLFRRLAVFMGGFTLEAAEAVAGAGALDGVAALLDRSLLQRGEVAGEPRFSMLETIREYALERLAENRGDEDAARAAHAAFFLSLAGRSRAGSAGPGQPAWESRLDAEETNLRAALGWCAGRAEFERDTHRFRALASFWGPGGGLRDRLLGLPTAGWRDPRRPAPDTRRLAPDRPGRAAGEADDAAEALRVLEEGVADARADGDVGALAATLGQLALAHLVLGAAPAARRLCEECVALGGQLDDRWEIAWGVHMLAVAAFAEGDWAAARAAFEQELALAEASQSPLLLARALEWLGNLALERGELFEAGARYERSLPAFRDARAEVGVAHVMLGLGLVALERGDLRGAADLLEQSAAMQQASGNRQGAVLTLEGLAGVAAGTPALAGRALRLAGAASAARDRPGLWRVWPTSRAARDRVERWLRPARRALGARAARVAWDAGRATPLEAALASALGAEPR
jgi:predicted ATPase/tetratricopeptide (TPR) repeat protein